MSKQSTITCPFTVLIDGREKAPYSFTGLRSDSKDKHRPLIVPTEWRHLETGDYTLAGMEDVICVERKSLADLYSTLGQHRDRFEREHQRMAEMRRAIVVIESNWQEIIHWRPERSQLNPKTVFRTAVSWHVRYGIPWIAAENRRFAEIFTFRFLEKAWKEFGHGGTERGSHGRERVDRRSPDGA